MLVLSLGTGKAYLNEEERYSTKKASKWGILGWVLDNRRTPILDIFQDASCDMVDVHVASLFNSFHCHGHYLRIQTDKLTGDQASLDIATDDNLSRLLATGNELLDKVESRVDLVTGGLRPITHEDGANMSNAVALDYFAQRLNM
ncbi:hypothetical protein RCOM_0601960 [Ricinus communis]|uniref:Patatin n=1 Tax=Ricinus communis TaxID=3988 RepID=B9S8K0_RICCO|nr:hypothetical protein RCOM_0601960 [Ricinus communis]